MELSKKSVDLSIPRYIQAALHRFKHSPPTTKKHTPHIREQPNYRSTHQLTKSEYTSQKFPPERIMRLQQITGTLLFYAKAIDLTILVDMGKLQQHKLVGKLKHKRQCTNYWTTLLNILILRCGTRPVW